MSNYTIADCKKLINESSLPYRIIRVNHIYRLVSLVSAPTEENKRQQAEVVDAPAITDVDKLYAMLRDDAEAVAKAIAEIESEQENLAGLSDVELAKHMSK